MLPNLNPQPKELTRPPFEEAREPARLWAEVKNRNSDAEVKLAGLYIQGTDVPKDCAQAQMLLQAASQGGNRRAAHMLRDLDDLCR